MVFMLISSVSLKIIIICIGKSNIIKSVFKYYLKTLGICVLNMGKAAM